LILLWLCSPHQIGKLQILKYDHLMLLNELRNAPYIPIAQARGISARQTKFESWVDTRRLKCSLKRSKTLEGHYKPTKDGIESILTNPVYIGWWLPIGGGVIENNHEAIVEEGLFT
jgi:hypothetical protein